MNKKSIITLSAFAVATTLAVAGPLNLKVGGAKLEGKPLTRQIENMAIKAETSFTDGKTTNDVIGIKPERPEDVPEVRLLFEDFSKEIWQTGELGKPDWYVELQVKGWNLDTHGAWLVWDPEVTNEGPWGGHYAYPAGGMVCLNSEKIDPNNQDTWVTSNICTKPVDSTDFDGIVHIRFKARMEPGCTNDGVLRIESAEVYANPQTGRMGPTWDILGQAAIPVTDYWQTFEWEVVGGKASVFFNIVNETFSNIYVDDIEVYSWKQPASTPVAKRHSDFTGDSFVAHWEPSKGSEKYLLNIYQGGELVMNPIETTETSYRVEGLDPSADYDYTVCGVKGDYVSYDSNIINVVDVAKPEFTNATIGMDFTTVNWASVECPQTVLYNHITYCERTVEETGDFYFVDENFDNLDYAEELKNAEKPVTVQYTIDNPGVYVRSKDYLRLDNTDGFAGYNYAIYNQTNGKGRHLTVDAYHQQYSGELAALISPEYDLSGADGEVTVTVDLAGERMEWQFEDGHTEFVYPHALITMFNWDEEAQDFVQYVDPQKKELFFIEDLSQKFKTYTVTFHCGSKRSKIGICGVYAPCNLYIDNVKMSQPLQKGDKFIDVYDFQSFLNKTSADVRHTNKSNKLPLYHRASSIRVLAQDSYSGGFSYTESPFNEIKFIEGSESYETGVSQVLAGEAKVSLRAGVIDIENPANAQVVVADLQGKVLYSGNGASLALQVEKGIYLVKVGNDVAKLAY